MQIQLSLFLIVLSKYIAASNLKQIFALIYFLSPLNVHNLRFFWTFVTIYTHIHFLKVYNFYFLKQHFFLRQNGFELFVNIIKSVFLCVLNENKLFRYQTKFFNSMNLICLKMNRMCFLCKLSLQIWIIYVDLFLFYSTNLITVNY